MCGLTGWIFSDGHAPPDSVLETMTRALVHRGPDDEGYYLDASSGVALGHRRLSIIDLSASSHQPMRHAATGVVLAYNGELYNFRQIRKELEALGHSFVSSGDTEVVLLAYIAWGIDCLMRFAGMFAIAIWDPRSQTVHLGRDALGMKPLYCLETGSGVAFASEVKAFRHFPGFAGALDPRSLMQYLEFGYVFERHQTSLLGVQKLDPGERWTLKGGRVLERVQWYTPPTPDPLDRRDLASRVVELAHCLEQVVQEHMEADVPVGMLLSGGLDSSVIAAIAARTASITTVCMGFGGSSVDEREFANVVARHIGSSHHNVLINPDEVRAEIERGAAVFDDLFSDWGTISSRILYRRCRGMGLKVVLVGEGSDELFGGYDIFEQPARLGHWGLFKLYRHYAGRRYGGLFGSFRAIMRDYLQVSGGDSFHAIRLFESRRQLPNCYVMKVDKASMSESVEARAPYLDRRVAEIAYRTPREYFLRNGENKHLLREVARANGLLPRTISDRVKFGAPLAGTWMDDNQSFRAFARDVILRPGSQTESLGLSSAMRAYFDGGKLSLPFPHAISVLRNVAWRLLLLELWAPHYVTAPTAR